MASAPHVGTWIGWTQDGQTTVTLNANGTIVLEGELGTYRIAGQRIWVTTDGETMVFGIQINGNRMVVSGGDLDQPLVLTRQGQPQQQIRQRMPQSRAQAGRTPTFLTYQTPTVRFGYPQGWQITPIQGGYYITESNANVPGPGYLMMGGPASGGITSSAAVARAMVQWLRMNIPTMAVVQQRAHPRVPGAVRLELSYTQGRTRFESVAFAHLNNGTQLFVAFYAPQNRAKGFDMDAMILGTIGPMYGISPQRGPAPPQPSAQAYWYAYLLQQQRLQNMYGYQHPGLYQSPYLHGAGQQQQTTMVYWQMQQLQQMAWMYQARGMPVPPAIQQQLAMLQQQMAALRRQQPGAPQMPSDQDQVLQRRLTEAQQYMADGKYDGAERAALGVYRDAEPRQFHSPIALVHRSNAAQLLTVLYYQQRRYDRFFEWMRVLDSLAGKVAPLMAQQSPMSEAETRALFRANNAMMAAEMHLAMREFEKAIAQTVAVEQLSSAHLGSKAGPAFRVSLLRSLLFRAYVLARHGQHDRALQASARVEQELPSLRRIRFGDLLVGVLAQPGAVEQLPPQQRMGVQALIDAANEVGSPMTDLFVRQWLCTVYFELDENGRARQHAEVMKQELPGFEQGLRRFSKVAEQLAATMPETQGLKLDLSNQFNTAPYRACCAKAAFRSSQWSGSERLYQQVLADPNVRHQGDMYWDSAHHMGMLRERRGDLQGAKRYYVQAVAAIESTRSSIQSDMTKMSFVGGDRSAVYGRLVGLLVRMGDIAAAFGYVERAKSRALVDLLVGHTIGRTDAERNAADDYSRRLAERHARASRAQRGPSVRAPSDTELTSVQSVQTLSLRHVQNMLPADVTLLEYYSTENGVYIWAISKGSAKCKFVSVERDKLTDMVLAHRKALVGGDNIRGFGGVRRSVAARPPSVPDTLYAVLIGPVRGAIRTRIIGIVPHGVLHYIPFCSLHDGQRYLVQDFAAFRAPSATVLQHAYRKGEQGLAPGMVAFGNPDLGDPKKDLKFAEEEVRRIVAQRPRAQHYTRRAASETRFRQEASQRYGIVHIACHGIFDSSSPLDSALLLARDGQNDGRLTAIELFNIQLGAQLVTLSACQTGLAKITPGDDLVGLTRGFIFAGASTIVASLWSVDDRATSVLMERFYQNLKRYPKAEALRQAQLATMRQFAHPGYWAAFTLTGDHR